MQNSLALLKQKWLIHSKKVERRTWSANRCTGASLLCASSTKRTISPIAVSPPGLRTSTVSVPLRFILPAANSLWHRKFTKVLKNKRRKIQRYVAWVLRVRKIFTGKWKSLPRVFWSLAMAPLWNLTHQQYFYQLWQLHLLGYDPKTPEKTCLRGFQQWAAFVF